MVERERGGLVIMSSLAGLQGSPPISVYAATKAFGAVLAEGLWAELRGTGVDVVTCVAGAVETPGWLRARRGGRRARSRPTRWWRLPLRWPRPWPAYRARARHAAVVGGDVAPTPAHGDRDH
jgi:short-subunit dehydrogenase